MKTTLDLDDELYGEVKSQSVALGISFEKFVEEALRGYIQATPPTPITGNISLSRSRSDGGLLPDFSTLEEAVAAADLSDDRRRSSDRRLVPGYRITTFVPSEALQPLLDGILRVVPLRYGNYDSVAWWSEEGTEQFKPLPGSSPTVGEENKLERVRSARLEFLIIRDPAILEKVLMAGLIPNHPWEEPVVLVEECWTSFKDPMKP